MHLDVETRISTDFSNMELPDVPKIDYYEYDDKLPTVPECNVCVFIGSHLPWKEDEQKALEDFCDRYDAVAFCDLTSNYSDGSLRGRRLFSHRSTSILHSPRARPADSHRRGLG